MQTRSTDEAAKLWIIGVVLAILVIAAVVVSYIAWRRKHTLPCFKKQPELCLVPDNEYVTGSVITDASPIRQETLFDQRADPKKSICR